jgi:hypothetical protein
MGDLEADLGRSGKAQGWLSAGRDLLAVQAWRLPYLTCTSLATRSESGPDSFGSLSAQMP